MDENIGDNLFQKYLGTVFVEDANQHNEECIVCKIENAPPKYRLACTCKAFAHTQCILRWLQRKRTCPHCGQDLVEDVVQWIHDFYDESARSDLDDYDSELQSEDGQSTGDYWGTSEISSILNHHSQIDENPFESLGRTRYPIQHALIMEHVLNYIYDNQDRVTDMVFAHTNPHLAH